MDPRFGISLYAGNGTVDGVRGDHVLLAPPYNVTQEEVDLIVRKTGEVVEAVFQSLKVGMVGKL